MFKENVNGALFITLEGGEGAGKSSLIQKLERYFTDQNREVVKTREPGGALLGEHIRRLLLDPALVGKIGARAELLLFLAARAQHVEEVIDVALASGKVVICDRFHDSTLAYQGMARGLGLTVIEELCLFSSQGLQPDLTLYLDIDPVEGLKRICKSSPAGQRESNFLDRIELEEIAFHECVRKGFSLLAERHPERILRIDGMQSPDEVYQIAVQGIERLTRAVSVD